jgi:hypothetical protein
MADRRGHGVTGAAPQPLTAGQMRQKWSDWEITLDSFTAHWDARLMHGKAAGARVTAPTLGELDQALAGLAGAIAATVSHPLPGGGAWLAPGDIGAVLAALWHAADGADPADATTYHAIRARLGGTR